MTSRVGRLSGAAGEVCPVRVSGYVPLLALGLALCPFLANAADSEVARDAERRFEALLINGGGQRGGNYQSHLLHLRELHSLLLDSGVPAERIAVYSSDGPDPAADLAVREVSASDAWLLDGTRLARRLDTRKRYVDSSVEGVELRPATGDALGEWFSKAGERLRSGDTLLLYVTDHGRKNASDTTNNNITLWGKDENLSVDELGFLLSELDPGVRVVALMSQCFSGSFANLIYTGSETGRPAANICGYFSSTEQRPAYGCYPENYDKEKVGHSFHFIGALREDPSFAEAQQRVLVSDRAPDVPLRTSDVYLHNILERAAAARELTLNRFVDQLLLEAWTDKAAWEPEIRLLDRIGQTFGFFSPRSLGEIAELADRLPEVSRELSRFGDAWNAARQSLNAEILRSFLATEQDWRRRLEDEKLKGLDDEQRRALASEVLAQLTAHAGSDAATSERLDMLNRNSESSRAAHYRMQVRLGALLRMKTVLTNIAGRVYLAGHASEHEAEDYAGLVDCEALTLSPSESTPVPATDPDPFPSYEDDLALTREILPGWMGVRYRPTAADVREEQGLVDGATDVLAVYPDSPAEQAGLEVGDIVLGPPDAPFTSQHHIREWVMTVPIGEPQPLLVRRDEEELLVSFTTGPYPIETPALPGPPQEGTVAPQLEKLEAYRGTLDAAVSNESGYLLFFWATWCGPCKAAIPELLAFESERGTPVIAITDERAAQLEPFLETRDAPFPETVAIDPRRRAFQAYGVSGTPSFVLVDGEGTVQSTSTGYTPARGLGVPDWSWQRTDPP